MGGRIRAMLREVSFFYCFNIGFILIAGIGNGQEEWLVGIKDWLRLRPAL
jgi:hypothetical protein